MVWSGVGRKSLGYLRGDDEIDGGRHRGRSCGRIKLSDGWWVE